MNDSLRLAISVILGFFLFIASAVLISFGWRPVGDVTGLRGICPITQYDYDQPSLWASLLISLIVLPALFLIVKPKFVRVKGVLVGIVLASLLLAIVFLRISSVVDALPRYAVPTGENQITGALSALTKIESGAQSSNAGCFEAGKSLRREDVARRVRGLDANTIKIVCADPTICGDGKAIEATTDTARFARSISPFTAVCVNQGNPGLVKYCISFAGDNATAVQSCQTGCG